MLSEFGALYANAFRKNAKQIHCIEISAEENMFESSTSPAFCKLSRNSRASGARFIAFTSRCLNLSTGPHGRIFVTSHTSPNILNDCCSFRLQLIMFSCLSHLQFLRRIDTSKDKEFQSSGPLTPDLA